MNRLSTSTACAACVWAAGICTSVVRSTTCFETGLGPSPCSGTSTPVVGCQNQACNPTAWNCVGYKIHEEECTQARVVSGGLSNSQPYEAICAYRVRTCNYDICGGCQEGDMAIPTRQCSRASGSACPPSGGGGGGDEFMEPLDS